MVNNWSGTQAQLNCNIALPEAVRTKGIPTLADTNTVYGNATSVKVITEHLQSVLRYAGVELTPPQLAETALSILSSYWFLNLAELCIFFSQLKSGSRGQFVWGSKINNQAIMVALSDFCRDRRNEYIKLSNEKIIEQSQKSYTRIEDAAGAMIIGVKNIQTLKEKAKNDFSAFTELFPSVPSNYTAEVYWKAYRGDEDAIRAIYGDNAPPPNIASDDIGRFLCDYNIRINRK